MSMNRKGGNAIVGLLLAHGEKLGIAVFAAIAGWLLYGALQYEEVGKAPSDLRTIARQAGDHVQSFTWEVASQEPEATKLANEFRPLASVRVEVDDYKIAEQGWNPDVVPPIVLRPDPELLPVTSLTASAGTELMGFKGDEAFRRGRKLEELKNEIEERKKREEAQRRAEERGERGGRPERDNRTRVASRGRGGASLDDEDLSEVVSYAIVLAKVPVKEQTGVFRKAFENALGFDANADQPEYLGYYVERRTVTGGTASEWGPVMLRNDFNGTLLEAVDSDTLLISTANWLERLDEVADAAYLHQVLTFPLPPIVGRDWGPEVVHPDVPTQAETERIEQELSRRGDELDFSRGSELTGFSAASRKTAEELELEGEVDEEVLDYEPLYPHPHLMLRFFDMRVDPGRQYQYRVRLVLKDPNGEVTRGNLAKEALARIDENKDLYPEERFRVGPWSEPSPPVSIPQAGGVLISEIEPPRTGAFNTEPSIVLVVDAFDTLDEKTSPSATTRKLQRGGVANFLGKDVKVIKDGFLETVEEFRYRTDVTVVDIYGGGQLTRDETAPAELLVMDASGNLSVRSELSDGGRATETLVRYSGEDDDRGGRGASPPSDFEFDEDDFF